MNADFPICSTTGLIPTLSFRVGLSDVEPLLKTFRGIPYVFNAPRQVFLETNGTLLLARSGGPLIQTLKTHSSSCCAIRLGGFSCHY